MQWGAGTGRGEGAAAGDPVTPGAESWGDPRTKAPGAEQRGAGGWAQPSSRLCRSLCWTQGVRSEHIMQDTQDSDISLEGLTREGAPADRECQRGPETIVHEAQDAGTPNSGGRTFPELLALQEESEGTWVEVAGDTERRTDRQTWSVAARGWGGG